MTMTPTATTAQRQLSRRCWAACLLAWSMMILSSQVDLVSSFAPISSTQQACRLSKSRIYYDSLPSKGENNNNDNASSSSSSSSCPFSKAFPRYRIDLSRFKTETKESSNSWFSNMNIIKSPFQDVSRSMARSKLEGQFPKKQKIMSTTNVLWEPETDGVAALALLWAQADELISSSSSSSEITTVVVGLPDSSRQVVQNFVEIIEWMSTTLKEEEDKDGSIMIRPMITASLVEISDDDVPAVKLQRLETTTTTTTTTKTNDDNIISTTRIINDDINPAHLQIKRTQQWVKRILVEQGICPFTKSTKKSGQGLADVGIPVASIAYHGSNASHVISLMADTWAAMKDMMDAGPSGKTGVSSILLTAPAFDDDFDIWSGPIFCILESSVVAAKAEAALGVVCFHPRYATPDGTSWPGFGHMHSVPRLEKWYNEYSEAMMVAKQARSKQSAATAGGNDKNITPPPPSLTTEEIAAGGAWQRRTPHATINVLRADQLAAAEGRRQSGSMYTENIQRLVVDIGSERLAQDLETERQLK